MLTDENGGHRSTVTISAKYVPVPIKLEMRETVNSKQALPESRLYQRLTNLHLDTGIIRVDVLEGQNLRSADRNGKSDPYCEFYLNDEKVFTTQIQKKTLNPKWNEVGRFLIQQIFISTDASASLSISRCWFRRELQQSAR